MSEGSTDRPRLMVDPKLEQYLRVHAPGEAPAPRDDLEAQRRPESLTTSRTRPLPVDWEALLASARISVTNELQIFRRELEATWGTGKKPSELVERYLLTDEELKDFSLVNDLPEVGRTDISIDPGSVVLRHGSKSNTHYLLRPREEGGLAREDFATDYESAWRKVARCTTVYRRATDPDFEDLLDEWRNRIGGLPLPGIRDAEPGLAGAAAPRPAEVGEMGIVELLERAGQVAVDSDDFERMTRGSRPALLSPLRRVVRPRVKSSDEPVATVRAELESSWTVSATAKQLELCIAKTTDQSHFRLALDKLNQEGFHARLLTETRESAAVLEREALAPVPAGSWLILLHGRSYLVNSREELEDLWSVDGYEKAWDKIASLELVMEAGRDLPFSHQLLCPLHLENIVAQFHEIDAEEPMAAGLAELGEKMVGNLSSHVRIDATPDDEIRRLTDRYRSLQLRKIELGEAKRKLQRQAAQLGYLLALVNGPLPDDEGTPGQKGRLYRQRFYWKNEVILEPYDVQVLREIPVPLGRFFHFVWERRYRPVPVWRNLRKYEEIPLGRTQWEIAQQQLGLAGFACIFFELSPQGYMTAEGRRLEDLVRQLDLDEAFRRRVAFFLPRYQQKLTRGLIKSDYLVVLRPLPGTVPIGLPGMYIEEETSYRLAWQGVEVGEVLAGVPLAPGETRKIEIAQQFERKVERVQSVTSALDVSVTTSYELTDAIEDTHRHESENTTTSSWNVQASGSYMGFSAGGGGGGSSTSTVRDFAQSIRRTASKAARELRQSHRQEVRTTTTEQVSLRSEERTSSTLTNVNQGTTLNVFFYRLNNVYEGGLYLESGRLLLQRSLETVAGTGIRDFLSFPLGDIGRFIDAVALDPLFLKFVDLHQKWAAKRALLRSTVKPLLSEYVDLAPADSAAHPFASSQNEEDRKLLEARAQTGRSANALRFDRSVSRVELEYLLYDRIPEEGRPDGRNEEQWEYERELAICESLLRKLTTTNLPIERHALVTPARAVYADAVVGQMPATEPYSERMRDQEIVRRQAESDLMVAQAALVEARAAQLRRGTGTAPELASPLASPKIRKAVLLDDRRIAIELTARLPVATWVCDLGTGAVLPVPASFGGKSRLELEAAGPLSLPDGSRMLLVEAGTGFYIEQEPA